MTRTQFTTYVSAILTTALETEPAPFPESMAYFAVGADLQTWTTLKTALYSAQLATFDGNTVTLTEKGRTLAREIEATLKEART